MVIWGVDSFCQYTDGKELETLLWDHREMQNTKAIGIKIT